MRQRTEAAIRPLLLVRVLRPAAFAVVALLAPFVTLAQVVRERVAVEGAFRPDDEADLAPGEGAGEGCLAPERLLLGGALPRIVDRRRRPRRRRPWVARSISKLCSYRPA